MAPRIATLKATWLAGMLLVGAGHAGAASIVADAETLGATADLTVRLPVAEAFTVAAAAQLRITLTDLASPQPFTQLKVLVSRGGTKVVALDAAGNQAFQATPGNYKVQVVGVPAQIAGTSSAAGTFQVEVRDVASNALVKQFTDGMAALPAPPGAQSEFRASVQFAQAGTYQVTLSDRGFPAALASASLLLSPAGAAGDLVTMPGTCAVSSTPCSFTVSAAGAYDLFVVATGADPEQAGLYSLKIAGGPAGTVVHASTQPVGKLAAPTAVTLPAAGAYTLSSTDLAVPLALSSLKVRLVQAAEVLASLDSPNASIASSAAVVGTAQLYTLPRAAAGGLGSYGVRLTQGAQSTYADVRTLPAGFDAGANAGGYRFEFTVPAAGNYRLRLRDLNFPAAFSQLRAAVVQNGVLVQSMAGNSIDSSFSLAAGKAFLAVIGSPAAANANSLMGISLAPQAGGTALLEQAQGTGPLFSTRLVNIPVAGSYDLSISDLQFPAGFSELAVAVTRGSELVGQVFGSDMLRFNAQAGTHSINLLARPDATAKYATWGFQLVDTPAAPVVTLAATPASIDANGTAVLSWSATGASSCAASGGWSGARATSGTETSVALGSATTFTLSCTGAGGSSSSSTTVTIKASSSGGGGALGAGSLLLLAAMLRARRRGPRVA